MKINCLLNNKGFAITGFLYSIFALFITILSLFLMNMINSKISLEKIKNNIKSNLDEASYDKNPDYRDSILNGADPIIKG
ncbi:MAG: hypothetical protein RR050_02235, partial [Bacilli bacterium]